MARRLPPTSILLLLALLPALAQAACNVFHEDRWLVKMSASAHNSPRGVPGGWRSQAGAPGSPRPSLVYKPWSSSTGIDRPGAGAQLKYNFVVRHAGHYRLVIRSYPKHGTEHNDLWARISSGAFRRRESRRRGSWEWTPLPAWFKVYNNRAHRWGLQTSTKDHDPQIIVSARLTPNRWYTLTIAGRSTRFAIDTIYLFHCTPLPNDPTKDTCRTDNWAYNFALRSDRPYSRCT